MIYKYLEKGIIAKNFYMGYQFFVEVGRRYPIIHIYLNNINLDEDFKMYFGSRKLIREDYIVDDGIVFFGNFVSYDYGNDGDYDALKKNDGKRYTFKEIFEDCVTLINFIDAYNYLKLKEQIKNDTLNVIDNINLLPSMNSLLNNLRDFSKYTKINLSLIITQINNLINLYEHDKTMEDLKEFEECKQACSNLIMNILQESEVLT
jgi:hypothetical protein